MQLPHSPIISLLDIILREIKIIYQHKNLNTNVYNSFILCSQKLETTQISYKGYIVKQNVLQGVMSASRLYESLYLPHHLRAKIQHPSTNKGIFVGDAESNTICQGTWEE